MLLELVNKFTTVTPTSPPYQIPVSPCCVCRSMSIVRWFAAIKSFLRDQNDSNQEIHYEFLPAKALKSGALKLFLTQCKTTPAIELRITAGNDDNEDKAREIAAKLNIDFDKLIIPKTGSLLAILRSSPTLEVIPTTSLTDKNDFAAEIVEIYPHALALEVIRWFRPEDNVRGTNHRVSYGMTQFGFAQDGLPTEMMAL